MQTLVTKAITLKDIRKEWCLDIPPVPEDRGQRIKMLRRERHEVERRYQSLWHELLPIEQSQRQTIAVEHQLLREKFQDDLDHLEGKYPFPRIDLNFLKLRRQQAGIDFPVPLFAVYALKNRSGQFMLSATKQSGWNPMLTLKGAPNEWGAYYAETLRSLEEEAKRRKRRNSRIFEVKVILAASFTGIIPAKTRAIIRREQRLWRRRFTELFLVCEVPAWQLDTVVTINTDPLLIGKGPGFFCLLDAFDTTTLENYVRSEFTTAV